MNRPLAGCVAMIACLTTAADPPSLSSKPTAESSPPTKSVETITLFGRVLPAVDALQPLGLVYDSAPLAKQVVLVSHAGSITPLLCDDASRALFQDERLRNRRSALTGRKHAGVPYFQVVSFEIEDEGRLRTPEYFCDICTISVRYPQICPCCQGDMVLRMRPDR